MKVTERTRLGLAVRKQKRDLEKEGYEQKEVDWRLQRGLGCHNWVILDVKISTCGKYVFIKTGERPET